MKIVMTEDDICNAIERHFDYHDIKIDKGSIRFLVTEKPTEPDPATEVLAKDQLSVEIVL